MAPLIIHRITCYCLSRTVARISSFFTGSRQSQSSVSEMMFMVFNTVDLIWFDSAFVDTCYKGASSNGNKNHEYLMGLAAT